MGRLQDAHLYHLFILYVCLGKPEGPRGNGRASVFHAVCLMSGCDVTLDEKYGVHVCVLVPLCVYFHVCRAYNVSWNVSLAHSFFAAGQLFTLWFTQAALGELRTTPFLRQPRPLQR